MRLRRAAIAAVAASMLAQVEHAHAQDAAAASALFDSGLADMQAGRYDKGCPALEESYRLDPQPGALFTAAECLAMAGKLAGALARYEEFLERYAAMPAPEQARQRARHAVAIEKKRALEPRVPRVRIVLEHAPAEAVVKRDGQVLGSPSLGVELPVDPGDHVVTVEVGGEVATKRFSVAPGDHAEVKLEAPSRAAPRPSVSATVGPAPPPPDTADRGASRRTFVWVAGGVGLAGLAVGGVFGVLALSKKGTIDDNCIEARCSPAGLDAADSGQTFAMVSNVGFVVGVAGVVAAAVLFATGPTRAPAPASAKTARLGADAWVGPDAVGLGARGAW